MNQIVTTGNLHEKITIFNTFCWYLGDHKKKVLFFGMINRTQQRHRRRKYYFS